VVIDEHHSYRGHGFTVVGFPLRGLQLRLP